MYVNTYDQLLKLVVANAVPVYNEGNQCLTHVVPNVTLALPNFLDSFPIGTNRKSYWKKAIREFVCYLRGYDNLSQFHAMGVDTWDNNHNNPQWLSNDYKVGEGHLGRIYGVQGRRWYGLDGVQRDQLVKIIKDLKAGIDDRKEIMTFWNPGELHMGCLAPCMHTHTFTLINGVLHLHSLSRSMDVALGGNFNVNQAWFFLKAMCLMTGHSMGRNTISINNAHIYDNQLESAKVEAARTTFPAPKMVFDEMDAQVWEDLLLNTHEDPTEHMTLVGYKHHEAIQYEFTTTNGVSV